MTTAATILLVLAGVAALVDWWSVATDRLGVEFIAKPMVIILLIGVALAIDTDDGVARGIVIAALGASLVGDVVLMTPDARFEAGLVAFLVAHVLYLAAFAPHVELVPALVATLLVVALGLGVEPQVLAGARQSKGPLVYAVGLYTVAVSATAIGAAGTGVLVAAVGGALFLVSDALLGWGRFVGPAPGGRVLVHGTYHVGQAGLVAWLAA